MKMSVIKPLILITLLLSSCSVINHTTNVKQYGLRIKSNNQCVVKKKICLKGDTLFLPANSLLVFKGGSINGGTIVGNNSQIISERYNIFKSVFISGTWDNDIVYSEWFDFSQDSTFDNRANFCNLTALSAGVQHTDIYMQKGVYWTSTRKEGYAISLPSNTTWHCSATIREIANSFENAALIKIYKADNVIIDNGVYIGDLLAHKGERGEWSHGILCMAASKVTIMNVECREFWGDGIDVVETYDNDRRPTLNCNNVKIFNSSSYYNRRAGIGLEAVINCELKGCISRFNGQIRGTMPMTGIGIESWNDANEKIKNIVIEDCVFTDNKNKDLMVYANGPRKEGFMDYDNNILVKNCKIGYSFVSYTNGIKLQNCDISKSGDYEYVSGLEYVNCTLKGKRTNNKINYLPKKK